MREGGFFQIFCKHFDIRLLFSKIEKITLKFGTNPADGTKYGNLSHCRHKKKTTIPIFTSQNHNFFVNLQQ